jgi:hypothetical protein
VPSLRFPGFRLRAKRFGGPAVALAKAGPVPGFPAVIALVVACAPTAIRAHNGPPFPIVSNQAAGPYLISIWTDPDTTDDGTPGGQFWVRLARAGGASDIPHGTRAMVSIRAADRSAPEISSGATPVRGDVTNQFAAVVMDHEGRFAVRVAIEGPLGGAIVNAEVDATYDLRPPRYMLFVYLVPFVLVGVLWGRLLLRRRLGGAG